MALLSGDQGKGTHGSERAKPGEPCWACTSKRASLVGIATIALVSIWLCLGREHSGTPAAASTNNGQRIAPISLKTRSSSDYPGGKSGEERDTGGGLVLIKSFKTGSTTLATYIAQVGHQRHSYFIHPTAKGWFAKGELESRREAGQRFDISLRHVTPYTPYDVLGELVPGAVFTTIMRDPVDRFLSLFNFRAELKRRFKTPQALVAAIRARKLPLSDGRPYCNQLAWLLSGQDVDYTNVMGEEETNRVAKLVIEEVERRNVTVLITERMSESVAVLAHRMGWQTDDLKLRIGSQRVQQQGHGSFSCSDSACTHAIRDCNLVDEVLYTHFKEKFDILVHQVPGGERAAAALLDNSPQAKRAMSRLELGLFPVNCVGNTARGEAFAEQDLFDRLHSCSGRPP